MMTVETIRQKLKELQMPEGWLSINGPDSIGATVIFYEYNKRWRVYQIADPHRSSTCAYDEWFVALEDALDYAYEQALKEAPYYHKRS